MNDVPKSLRVLVIDDEAVVADTMALVLNSKGHVTRVAYCAEDAVALLPEFLPDVVISDVVMGAMTGIDLAIYLAQQYPTCKVLLMSGHTATAGLLNTTLPADLPVPVLAKPVHPSSIFDFLASCTA